MQLVGPATDRLAGYRRAAIPQIETAMHTSAPTGRLHLIAALEKIGDGEAIPILRHVAVFDITPDVRGAAEDLLSRWAAGTDEKRARRARARPRWPRSRASAPPGSGRCMFGDGGMPGVPSTIGAPEPRRLRQPKYGPPRCLALALNEALQLTSSASAPPYHGRSLPKA